MAKRSIAVALLVTLALLSLAPPTVTANPLAWAALRWIGGFLAQWILGKVLDRSLGLDSWNDLPARERREFQARLSILEDQNAAIAEQAARLTEQLELQRQRLDRIEAEIALSDAEQAALYSRALEDLSSADQLVNSRSVEYAALVSKLNRLPEFVNSKNRQAIEDIRQVIDKLESRPEADWVNAVNALLKRSNDRITSLESRIEELEAKIHEIDDRDDEQESRLDEHGVKLEGHDATLGIQREQIADLQDFQRIWLLEAQETDAANSGRLPKSAVLMPIETGDALTLQLYRTVNYTLESYCGVSVIPREPKVGDPFTVAFRLHVDISCSDHAGYRGFGNTTSCRWRLELHRRGAAPYITGYEEANGADSSTAHEIVTLKLKQELREEICGVIQAGLSSRPF